MARQIQQHEAKSLVMAAVKAGLTPERRLVADAYGPYAAEVFTLIRRKREAEGKEMARRIAKRNGETQDRTPVAGADIDLETAISEAIAELKAPETKPSSDPKPAVPARNSTEEPAEPEAVDPRALAEAILNPPKKLSGGHPGYVIAPMTTDGQQHMYRRDEAPMFE